MVVKLPPVLWSEISSEAKELIRGLMNTNPKARLTMANVLMHPWLKEYRYVYGDVWCMVYVILCMVYGVCCMI